MQIQTATIERILPTRIWIESDMMGYRHVVLQHEGCEPFDYASFGYDYRYTSNSGTWEAARQMALALGATEPIEQRTRDLPPPDSTVMQYLSLTDAMHYEAGPQLLSAEEYAAALYEDATKWRAAATTAAQPATDNLPPVAGYVVRWGATKPMPDFPHGLACAEFHETESGKDGALMEADDAGFNSEWFAVVKLADVRLALAAATAAQPAIPPGFALVPLKPTGAMVDAAHDGWDDEDPARFVKAYRAMLAAAPKEAAATAAQPTQQHLLDIAWATIAGQKKELDRLRLEMSETGHLGHAAVEAECVHMALDKRRVPREEAGQSLSLWGRVLAFAGAQEAQP